MAWRLLNKDPFYTWINIAGLAIGVATCLAILLYVWDELTYDTFPERAADIYRVTGEVNFGGNHQFYAVAPAPMAGALQKDYPEVERSFRFRNWGNALVRTEEDVTNVKEEHIAFSDPNFFSFFSIPILSGDPRSALTAPDHIALSASTARKYFGDRNPVGETLILNDEDRYEVAAVYEDIPAKAHFDFDLLLAMEGLEDSKSPVWLSNNYHTYITLRPGADPRALEAKFEDMFRTYAGPQVKQLLDKTIDEVAASGQGVWYSLQPLRDIHLRSDLSAEIMPNGDIRYVYLFSSIALFILLIACINFMNLATARSAVRAKEVGVRKTLGAMRRQLVRQFLSESVAMSFLAVLLAVGITQLVLGPFGRLIDRPIALPFDQPLFYLALLAIALAVGLLAGSYPAFYLSAFKPVDTLKGRVRNSLRHGALRYGLVVFQFVISIFLVIGTLVIYRQMEFIRNKKLGFDREQVLLLHDAYAAGPQLPSLRRELASMPDVRHVTLSSYLPVSSARSDLTMWPEGPITEDNAVNLQFWQVDEGYIPTLDLELVDGRNFAADRPADSTAIILNQRAAEQFGFSRAERQRITTFSDNSMQEMVTYEVIGIVEDFHFESLRENVSALALILSPSRSYMAIRYAGGSPGPLIDRLEDLWDRMAPGQPFAYSFLDDRFEATYEAELRTGRIFLVFAGLAIFIACLGLFALATFTAERRTKEIGIRKVMGASPGHIFVLLSAEFTRWVGLAYLVALPLGWFFARRWLQDYAYQAGLSWWLFVIAAAVAVLIALLAVSYQALRAAYANPVRALRYE